MIRYALYIGFLIGVGTGGASQNDALSESAKITLTLPSNVPSEAVQIRYFMTGPFGGFGDFVRAEKGKSAYDIAVSVDGKAAADIKILAYMPGCEIVTLEIPIGRITPPHSLTCKALRRTLLRGQILPASVMQERENTQVKVSYLAMWDHQFFGIVDGPVTSIQVATAVPDKYGQFEIWLPDFSSQTNLGEGVFQSILQNTTTGNIAAVLEPTGEVAHPSGVKVRASYPWVIEFFAREH